MDSPRFSTFCLPLLLLSTILLADAGNDSSINEHRVPRVSGRIVKVYSGYRPEPYLCNTEGYKADPHSCASFYRCVKERNGKFNVFRYQCAPGTVYDPDLQTCNHPQSTRRTECGGMMPPAASIDSTQVNDIEIKKELPRPINNELAFIKETTAKEGIATTPAAIRLTSAATKKLLDTTAFTLAAYVSDTTKHRQDFTENTSWTNKEFNWAKTTSKPKVSNFKDNEICTDDGFTGDTDNCRKFYRCVGNARGGFLRYEFFCSETTVWDEQIQSCNHPWAVKRSKCGRSLPIISKLISTKPSATSNAPETSTTSPGFEKKNKTKTIQQQLQISYGSKVTQTQTQISNSDQVIQNQTQIHYGDRISQNKVSETKQNQTQIAHGSAVSQTQTQIDYGSKGMQTQLQIDHTKDSSQTQTQINESTTLQSTTLNQNNQCTESGFMGDSNDCKKFYRCVDNGRGSYTKYEYKCGEGTVWDQSIEACNHAWAVKECGGHSHSETQPSSSMQSTTYREETTTTQIATQSTTEASEPEIDDIDVGYGNQGESESTTTSKTTIKPQYQTTKGPQNAQNNNNVCKSSGFMGDTNNCKKFYRCVDNGMGGYTRHEFTCGEGTVWDTSIEACNHAWAVKSCSGSDQSIQSTTSVSTTAATSDETTGTPGDKNTEEPIPSTSTEGATSTTTATVSNADNKCKQSGFMGDNQNCKIFYRCVDNGDGTYTRYEYTCGEGTVWDSRIYACNHEWAVEKCGGTNVSTTQSESTTSTSKQPTLQDEDNEPITENNEVSSTTQHLTSTVKNEVPAPDQECTSAGFVGDKNDCKKFYRCVENNHGGYDRYQFSCGEGTVWDESILACNHAWAVERCGKIESTTSQSNNESTPQGTPSSIDTDNQETSQQPTEHSTSTTGNTSANENIDDGDCNSEGFFGSSVDCKKFIRCVGDGKGGFTKYEFTCGEGTTWNQNIAACDHPSSDRPCGQNYQSTTKASPVNDEMITETTTKTDISTSSPDKEESQAQKPQQTSSGKCKSEGFYGDPSDCKKFYRCVDDGRGGYTKYDFTCGDGTVWNQEIVACDHESDDKTCLSSTTRPSEENSLQSQSTTSESTSEGTASSSTTSDNQGTDTTESNTSNDECTSEGFFPHSNDCKKFKRCVSNGDGSYTRYEFSCGQGTVWVQEIQTCDHDNGQSTCGQQNETPTKPQNSGSSSPTTESTSNTENQTQNKEDDEYQTTKQPTNVESDKCTSEGYFGNKYDCRKFYRCVDNGDGSYTKYDFDCGEGTAWDSNLDTCNHINEVESCSENNKESQTQQTIKDEEVSQTTEDSSSTTKGSTSTTESNKELESESNTGSNDKCESEGYYGDSKDCKKFYRCVDDGKGGFTKYDFVCGEGTIWDQDITNCNHPQDVNNPSCMSSGGDGEDSQASSTGSSTSSTTSSPESTSSSTTSDNSTQSSSNCTQEESSKKPAGTKDIKCDKAGYYPNPNDCKKFYRCVDWDGDGKRFSVYHFECGEGTIWDPALDTCNHEESVYPPRDCSQTQSQSETTDGTTQKQEESTTQELTTTEQTTTQETTTAKQTTTEQEKSTTEQSTTSKQTTTQQSTTSDQTTTQQSTTSKQTTTQQSTTTTQESTTSEQTTQESTTSEQTTQELTTSEQTTQESTTSEQTTQESTTSEQTTQESTTNEQTTQESTTSEQSESSNTEGTTEAENSSTTEQSSTTEVEQESTTASSSDKECPETENDQYIFVCPTSFKRHPKYCNMFYQCTEDNDTHEVKIATFKCPNETIYDESQSKCVEENEADKKCNGEIARRHRFKRLHRDSKEPITVDTESKSCPTNGYYAFEKNVECSNGFLKCEKSKSGKIRGYVHQCPEGFLFWAISKRCELGRNIRDCKRSSNDWTERWNIPIDRKNIAF